MKKRKRDSLDFCVTGCDRGRFSVTIWYMKMNSSAMPMKQEQSSDREPSPVTCFTEEGTDLKDRLKDIQTYWDARSEGFSDSSQEELASEPGEWWKDFFRNTLKPGCSVLDDGAGAGFFTVLLAALGYQTTAIDYSTGMVDRIRSNLEEQGFYADVRQMDVQRLEFPDESFDAVVSRNVFWNLEEPEEAYKEICRVLRPGGILILEDGNFYLRYHNEAYRKAYQEMQSSYDENSLQDCHSRHNPNHVDFTIMEEIARDLPLSFRERPVWDFEQLVKLDFRDIRVNISGKNLPMGFRIVAEKGR